jgi:TPR repeat protein
MKTYTRAAVALTAIAAAGSACGGIQLMNPHVRHGFDSQTCVEAALRAAPEDDILPLAFEQFDRRCAAGDPAACSTQGVMYELGLAAPRNEWLAVRLYQRACAAGNDGGCTNLGLAYAAGKGVAQDTEMAVKLLSGGCRNDHGPACGELGMIFLRGAVVRRSDRCAARLLERACHANHHSSCFELADLYTEGRLQPPGLGMQGGTGVASIGGADSVCDSLPMGADSTQVLVSGL